MIKNLEEFGKALDNNKKFLRKTSSSPYKWMNFNPDVYPLVDLLRWIKDNRIRIVEKPQTL